MLGLESGGLVLSSYWSTDIILHNDIKPINILLTDSMTESQPQEKYIQIVLVDFGKATSVQNDCKYNLSDAEKAEYFHKYP